MMADNGQDKGGGEDEGGEKSLGRKSDMMYDGVDWELISRYEKTIEEMKGRLLVPSSYSIHNAVQLLPERVIDTTNRSHVLDALKDGFDPDGFKAGKPLQKSLFYMNPFITCSWCNAMNYVDVVAVRRMLSLPDELKEKVATEALPPCQGCGRADGFEVGANDFEDLIEKRKAELLEKQRRVEGAVIYLQRMYRAHLRYLYGYAYNRKLLARARLLHRAATQIQAMARVRLSRRILKTERALLIIKSGHPKLLERALEPKVGRSKVFWYKTKLEEQLLYADYVNLASRTGFQPPRMIVERNIRELAKRIRDRENELVRLVQKRWRGVMTRRIVKLFKLERIRNRQWQVSHVMKIQRLYRGHRCRLRLPDMKAAYLRDDLMKMYTQARKKEAWVKDREWAREHARALYSRERREEMTARATYRVDAAKYHEGRKMKAFSASCYSDERLHESMVGLLNREAEDMMERDAQEQRQRDRKAFLVSRVKEHGPKGYGNRGFHYSKAGRNAPPPHNDVKAFLKIYSAKSIVNSCSGSEFGKSLAERRRIRRKLSMEEEAAERAVPGSRSKGMEKFFAKELEDIISAEVEKAEHNFSKKGLLQKLRNHNRSDGMRHAYRYPTDINVDPMKWLNDDVDSTIKYQDQKMNNRLSAV